MIFRLKRKLIRGLFFLMLLSLGFQACTSELAERGITTTLTQTSVTLSPTQTSSLQNIGLSATVERVVDGDTLRLVGHEKSIRLIGVDTPETQKELEDCGPTASNYTKELLTIGTAIELVYDKDRTDHYGRTLAYIYRSSDKLFVNAEIIRKGYGEAKFYSPNYAQRPNFMALQKQAQADKLGMWGSCNDLPR